MPTDFDGDDLPIPGKIGTILDHFQFNGQAESRAIAELIGDSLTETPAGEELTHAIAMCNAFVDYATSMRSQLSAIIPDPTE